MIFAIDSNINVSVWFSNPNESPNCNPEFGESPKIGKMSNCGFQAARTDTIALSYDILDIFYRNERRKDSPASKLYE